MVMSSCKFLSNLDFNSHPIVIRMDHSTFLATWDDTGNVGIVYLTKTNLKELITTSTGSDKGEDVTSMLKQCLFHCVVRTLRSQTKDTYGNGSPCVQIETEI